MLSPRLMACAALVTPGASVCDVGTDHAKLAVYLLESGRAQEALASDIGEGPLRAADRTIREHGLTGRIRTILSDGLMEVILIRKPDNPADNAKMLGAVLMQDTSSEFITYAHTAKLSFEAEEPVSWTVDGENGGAVRSGEVSVLKGAVDLYL